ncbi:mandelate racemase/muconate lactonizing enzyme family protein [Dactylosporangium sp. McL0621]|uniref:mandelate racemase/muconate lactonizing enzyme family protein n=1 Tax=Dactylosporangium sp. McL0621 TaxID=3415678 RepID=UPI003CE67D6D
MTLRITGYRTLTTVHEWGRPVGDANGVFADGVTSVPIVMVDTDEGITGVGLGPHLDIDAVFAAIEGEDPRAVTALYDRMLRQTFKAGHAGRVFGTIGALDSALWDIKAQAAGQPLWRLLGGRDRTVAAYASGLDIGLTDEQLVAVYREYAERGIQAAKLKGGLDVERDKHRLGLVRQVLAEPGHVRRPGLMLDANECWNRKQAVRHIGEIEQALDLIWVEEPVRRWDADGLATVSRGVRAAVATGENLTGLEQFRPLVAAGAVDVVQTASVWGVTHFLRVAALAHAYDLPVSPIGTTPMALLHAATSVPNHLTSELQDLRPPVGVSVDLEVEDGVFVLGESPGLGVTVDEHVIVASTQRSNTAEADSPNVRPEEAGRRLLGAADGARGTATPRQPAVR